MRASLRGLIVMVTAIATMGAGLMAVRSEAAEGPPAGTQSSYVLADSVLQDIAVGSDGSLWATDQAGLSIVHFTSGGTTTDFPISPPLTPDGIAPGPDGNMWFAAGNRVGRIAPSGTIATFTATGLFGVTAIAAGSDGAMWFTANSAIGRINMAGEITRFDLSTTPRGIAAGPDGAIWFTTSTVIGRISTTGQVSTFSSPGLTQPRGITNGPDGRLWFTNRASLGTLTTGGAFSFIEVGDTNGDFWDITSGPDGGMWFTDNAISRIGRATTSGSVTFLATPGQNQEGNNRGIDSDPSGAVWYTNFGDGHVGRIQAVGPPSAPLHPVATAGDAAATVTWTAPALDGGSPLVSYAVTASPSGNTCKWNAGPLLCTIDGLTNGVTYTFSVTATNSHGIGAASISSNAVQPGSSPATIGGIVLDMTGSAVDDITVTLMQDWPSWVVEATTVTDSSGSFTFDVPPGVYRVRYFDASGLHRRTWHSGKTTYRSSTPLIVGPGTSITANQAIESNPGSVAGRAVHGPLAQLKPVEGIAIWIFDDSGYVAGTTSGPNGYFTIHGLPPSTYKVLYTDPLNRYPSQWYRLTRHASDATPVAVAAASSTWVSAWMFGS